MIYSQTTADILTIGWLDTLKLTTTFNFVEKKPKESRIFSIGFIASTDTTFAPTLKYRDRKNWDYTVGYEMLNKAVQIGFFLPLNK